MEVRACYAVVVEAATYKSACPVVGPLLLPPRVTFEAMPSAVRLERFQLDFTLIVSLGGRRRLRQDARGEGEGNCSLPLGRPGVAVCLRVCGRLLLV